MKKILFLCFLLWSCSSSSKEIVKGSFVMGIENIIFYQLLLSDEPDEYVEKSLIMYNILNQERDTLVKSSFFISISENNYGNVIFSDGASIMQHEIFGQKEYSPVFRFDNNNKIIISLIAKQQTIYFFAWDQENSIISFYSLINGELSPIANFPLNNIEYHGFKSVRENSQVFFTIEGVLYKYDLEHKTMQVLSEFHVKDFAVCDNKLLLATNTEIMVVNMNNIMKDLEEIIVRRYEGECFSYGDRLFLFEDEVYFFNSLEGKNFIFKDNQKQETPYSPVYRFRNNIISFINDKSFLVKKD